MPAVNALEHKIGNITSYKIENKNNFALNFDREKKYAKKKMHSF